MTNLVIRDALVLDGTGSDPFPADVAVQNGMIVDIGRDVAAPLGAKRIDAGGRALAPGFIDLHTHSDFGISAAPRGISMISQGVTTQVAGNCGFSPFPAPSDQVDLLREYTGFLDGGLPWGEWETAADFLALLDRLPLAGNIACQVGHGTVRIAAMGFDNAAADEKQREAMRALVGQSVDAGAVGISSGLTYAPAAAADLTELVAVAAQAKSSGAVFYSSHIRSEALNVVGAIDEALAVGSGSGLPVQISHLKIMGAGNWSKIDDVLRRIDGASVELGTGMDQYPYTAGSTTLAIIVPGWATEGGTAALQRRLTDPGSRRRIHRQIVAQDPVDLAAGLRAFEPENIVLAHIPDPTGHDYLGLSLAAVAAKESTDPVTVALDLIQRWGGDVLTVVHGQSEDNLRRILRHPATAVASDGWAVGSSVGAGLPHPRNYGTFPRVLGRYVREEGVLSLADAVRKMTGLPASRLRLADRGVIAVGRIADLVLFRPDDVDDKATFQDPTQFCTGIDVVVVAGQIVRTDGVDTGETAGRVLRQRGGVVG